MTDKLTAQKDRHTPGPWRAFPPRQLTGSPYKYHGYIGREKIEELCCSSFHRSPATAFRCANRAAIAKAEGRS